MTVVIDCGVEASMGIIKTLLPRFSVGSKAIVKCTSFSVIQVSLPTVALLDDEHGVRTWWPRGYGSQPLYDLTVSCQYKLLMVIISVMEVAWCSRRWFRKYRTQARGDIDRANSSTPCVRFFSRADFYWNFC